MPTCTPFLALALLLLVGACASSEEAAFPEEPGYLVEAATRYGDTALVETFENEASTHVLVAHNLQPTSEQPLPMVSFFVYDLATDSVVYDEIAVKGFVAWEDSQFLKVELTPGTVPTPVDTQAGPQVYYVDVYTGARVDKQ